MSIAGLNQFKKNLDILFESDKFTEAKDVDKLNMGFSLLNSKYGLNRFGRITKCLKRNKKNIDEKTK